MNTSDTHQVPVVLIYKNNKLLFNHAINYYQNTANSLSQLIKLFPLDDETKKIEKNKKRMPLICLSLRIKMKWMVLPP